VLLKPTRPQEVKALLVIALPLVFAYLADVMMIVTAKMVVGRLGALELAAAGISTDLSYQMCIVLMGFFSVVGVLVSGALGAGRKEEALPELVRSMLLAGVLGLIVTFVVLNLDVILKVAQQDTDVIAISEPFYKNFALAMLPIIWFGVLRSFAAAMMRTGFVLAITILTVVMNYILMQGLVHGDFGLPKLGIGGAGIAWAISMWFKCLCLGAYTLWLVHAEKLSANAWHVGRWRKYMPLVALGLPVAGIVGMESGLFAATALLSGILGPLDLAAYQIVMGWIAIPFVISLGISEAAMVRVAYWMGADDPSAARQAGNLGMVIGVAIPLVLVTIPVLAPDILTRIFLDTADPSYREIAALVSVLLIIAAIFQVFDGLQVIASHALRGLRDAVIPLMIAGVGYWIIGMGSAYLMGFWLGWGSPGLWTGLAIGLAFTATLLAWRFELLAKRGSRISLRSDPWSR
jgi:multidrug resistance protein, MATE family